MQFTWRAVYRDGTIVRQTERQVSETAAPPKENRYEGIDRRRIEAFDLVDQNGRLAFRLHVDSLDLVWFWRRRVIMTQGKPKRVIHLVGWKDDASQAIAFIFEDGSVFLTSKWNNPVPFDPPRLHGNEVKH